MDEYTVIKSVLSSLIGSALKENNKSIVEWLSSKVQSSFPDLENDIMKWATDQAFYEDENYKPSELVKSYARKFYGPLEGDQEPSDYDGPGPEGIALAKEKQGAIQDAIKRGFDKTDEKLENDSWGGEQMADLIEALKDDPGDDRWD